ncbi:LysM domain-containing protein [Sphaerothrix gracilis]|uniref:LysM domain-containing protein n=1 Tax=Sphaerothrix gracilis TaxID=3151835 RepID=UPI0031FD1BEF
MLEQFSPTSRYHLTEVATYTPSQGDPIAYLRRRFIPPPAQFALLQEHTVRAGDRPDLLAAQYLGDPEQFWQLCDANAILQPNQLVEPVGRKLRITLPAGIPGATDA